jgi:hypothetical protein
LLAARSLDDLNARAVRYFLDVSPPTDARPFFFNQLRLTHLGDISAMIQEWRNKGNFSGAGLVVAGNLIAIGTLCDNTCIYWNRRRHDGRFSFST